MSSIGLRSGELDGCERKRSPTNFSIVSFDFFAVCLGSLSWRKTHFRVKLFGASEENVSVLSLSLEVKIC